MHRYFFTVPIDNGADPVDDVALSVGDFVISSLGYQHAEGESFCCSFGATFYTPNSEDEAMAVIQALDNEKDINSKYDDELEIKLFYQFNGYKFSKLMALKVRLLYVDPCFMWNKQ